MGKKNRVICGCLEKPEKFADFINGSLYEGRQVLLTHEVKNSPTVYTKEERTRDILRMVYNGENYVLIGLENQDSVHYAMPVRCMEYDALEYKRQLKELGEKNERRRKEKKTAMSGSEFLSGMKKEDRLIPVVTIVFYHGEEEYDGCRSLHDMLNWKKENEIFKQFIADYKINLVTLQDLNEENFRTGIRELVGFLKRRESKDELRRYCEENESRMQDMDEDTFDTISVMINQPDFMEQKRYYRQEGENINMCKAMKDWGEELRQEGMEQGIEQGIEAFVLDYLEEGFTRERIIEKLRKRFGLDERKAEDYFSKYAAGL